MRIMEPKRGDVSKDVILHIALVISSSTINFAY